MQFQQNSDHFQRNVAPSESPWRNNQLPFEGYRGQPAQSLNHTSGPGLNSQPGGIKLPNLPRLGSQSQISDSGKSRPSAPQSTQPTFAQIVQQGQQGSGPSAPTGKVLRGGNKLNSNNVSNSSIGHPPLSGSDAAPHSGTNADSANYNNNSGAQILGSVNSHMMPRVNTSHGMSSLNTVLPGMTNSGGTKHPSSRNYPGTGPSSAPGVAQANGSVPNSSRATPMLQGLSIDEKNSNAMPNTSASKPVETEKYGLKTLLGVVDGKGQEKQSVILGDDLSQSGLRMDGSAKLSQTFSSPWRETSKYPVIPDYRLPACYSIDTVVPQQQKLQNFDEGALFYIFYTMPRDAMQEAAAVELTNRSWRYHKELKMWLTKDPMSEPIQTNNQEESGIYIFFDPTTWKKVKREYILFYPDIA